MSISGEFVNFKDLIFQNFYIQNWALCACVVWLKITNKNDENQCMHAFSYTYMTCVAQLLKILSIFLGLMGI